MTGSESSPVVEAELNWGMAGGTDCGAAATCDDCGPDSISPTIKFDPAIHSAKLMYFFNDQLGSALGMTRRISSTNPHQNPSIKVRSSHDGTFAAGYTRDAWEKWQIVYLAALSVEDAEDIYLFGTMITGILLIGLGFTLGYRKIQKTGTAVQSLTRLPVLIEAVGRAVSNETETINRNMDTIMMKLAALEVKFGDFRDQNGQRE